MTWQTGFVYASGGAQVQGLDYSRIGNTAGVSEKTPTIFLEINRTPVAFAAGGYYAPEEE